MRLSVKSTRPVHHQADPREELNRALSKRCTSKAKSIIDRIIREEPTRYRELSGTCYRLKRHDLVRHCYKTGYNFSTDSEEQGFAALRLGSDYCRDGVLDGPDVLKFGPFALTRSRRYKAKAIKWYRRAHERGICAGDSD